MEFLFSITKEESLSLGTIISGEYKGDNKIILEFKTHILTVEILNSQKCRRVNSVIVNEGTNKIFEEYFFDCIKTFDRNENGINLLTIQTYKMMGLGNGFVYRPLDIVYQNGPNVTINWNFVSKEEDIKEPGCL